MPLQWRPMQANDVAVRQVIAAHPVIGPRYGAAIKDLPRCWLRLLGSEAMIRTPPHLHARAVEADCRSIIVEGSGTFIVVTLVVSVQAGPNNGWN